MGTVCTRCGTPFDTAHSAAQHLWKSQDSDHEDVQTLDAALEEVVKDGKSTDEAVSMNGDEPSPDGAEEDGAEPSETVTDGGTGLGLDGPPEPTADESPSEAVEGETEASVTCPHCGHEHDDEDRQNIDRDRTYRCGECGETANGSELL